jgi:NadR type nicotinamide-nucleotide adenylyltransferase
MGGVVALAPPGIRVGDGMSERFRRGLVVGKFCPLHLGHEFLIRRAQAQCDEVIVLSYTKPGFEGYDRERRLGWLQQRFPDAMSCVLDDTWLADQCRAKGLPPRELPLDEAPDDVHRRFVTWVLAAVLGTAVDAVFTSERYGDGFADVLSRELGVPVVHVCVDLDRNTVPVSGTQIRANPLACRHLLAPEVYADFVPRVALLGGESTGKTTLAAALALALGTTWASEYGRELWERQDGVLRFEDMEHIAQRQLLLEQQQAGTAHGVLLCDTTPLTTLFYSEAMFGRATELLQQLAKRRYALTLLCLPDFPFVQDGTRRDDTFRRHQHDWYERALDGLGVDYKELGGSVEQRVQIAKVLVHELLRSRGLPAVPT